MGEWDNIIPKTTSKRKKKEVIKVTIPQFITHVNKTKKTKTKINGQNIFNGRLHHYTRASMVKDLHEYLKPYVDKALKGKDLSSLLPLSIRLEVYAPINYGSVRYYKGEIRWKKPAKGYVANWDADNLWIWGKVFNDTLTENGYIEDDSVSFITDSGRVKFKRVDEFDKRKLVFVITKDS